MARPIAPRSPTTMRPAREPNRVTPVILPRNPVDPIEVATLGEAGTVPTRLMFCAMSDLPPDRCALLTFAGADDERDAVRNAVDHVRRRVFNAIVDQLIAVGTDFKN